MRSGRPSCAVPGLPAVLGELSDRLGRLPWMRLCEPALALARDGVPLPEMHARTLEMLGELYRRGRGAELYLSDGMRSARASASSARARRALDALAEEGASSVYRATLAEELLRVDGVVLHRDDLADYRALWREPVLVPYYGDDV